MKNIKLAIIAIVAAAFLTSCSHTGSNVGQQDDVMKVSLTATIEKPFLDHDMIPVILQGKEIYCYYSEKDYKTAVNTNAHVIDGDSVSVKIIPIKPFWVWGTAKYRITETFYFFKPTQHASCDSVQKVKDSSGKLVPVHKGKGKDGIKQVKPVKTAICWNTPCYVPENGGGRVINISINGNGANVIIGDRNNTPSPTFDPVAFPIFNNLPCDTTIPRVDLK